ncbi:MAG: extracellular solute-binding protein family 3 [Herbaspirillum sp.]|jgi:ABC-type nitrate/sulfonate/bicarbonate transport system substrate-binding protein|nr:extracellular solute-binding protein family 3 [Herbaspirillum sp.]
MNPKGLLPYALACCAVSMGLAAAIPAMAQADVPVRELHVIAFDGGWNLPVWAGQSQGFFQRNGLKVDLKFTPNSVFLVDSLFAGKSDIALASFDNVVAYQEGQGDAAANGKADPDLFAFMGGDNGFLTLTAAPAIHTFSDLRGKTMSVDAMGTGFAFALREMIALNGLAESEVHIVRAGATANRYKDLMAGKSDATLLRTPFEILSASKGFNSLATGSKTFGAYMGTVGVARRSWAQANDTALVAFLRSYKAALDWSYAPENRAAAEALLIENVPGMTPDLAKRSYDTLLARQGGLIRDLRFDMAGVKNVLDLRSKYAQPAKTLSDPNKYLDDRYLKQAFDVKK